MGHFGRLVTELRRRRVFRTAGIYVVGAWVALQVADLALDSLGIPATTLRYVWIAVFIGFPLALVFGWRYDVTVDGIVRTPAAGRSVEQAYSLRFPDYLILGTLVAITFYASYGIIQDIRLTKPNKLAYQNSIAVLPLENMSGERDYFSAGMHDELITTLSKITSLRVTSRTSAMRVDSSLSIPQIGAVLGVENIVEGSVTREGDRVRIIVQLIDAATDTHIWAESYEREMTGMLTLQRDISRAIAGAIHIQLTAENERFFSAPQPVTAQTYEAYLKGMFQLRKGTRKGYRRGIELLTAAVENDPTSAFAYAGLAYGYGQLGHSPYPIDGAYPRAKEAAQRALDLDDSLAEAHLAVGMYKLYYEWDWAGAEESLLKAIDLNPSLVDAHYHYAWLMELLQKDEEALAYGERTRELNPLSPFYTAWLADQYRSAGLYEKAVSESLATLELSTNYPVAWLVLGEAYIEMGRFDDAIEAHDNLENNYFWGFVRGDSFAAAGRIDDAIAVANAIEENSANPFPLALIYAAIGDREKTFYWLDQAREKKIPWYPWLVAWFPQMARFNDDPQLRELAAALNLELPPGSTR